MNLFKTGSLLAVLTALFGWIGYMIGGQNGMIMALGLAAVMNIGSWWFSDKMVLSMYGAKPVESGRVYEMTRELAMRANLPTPKVYVLDQAQPNAFATGRSPKHSVVCVTRGLLDTLEPKEVELVLAHELSHVAHRDVTVMTVAGVTGVVASLMVRAGFYTGGRSRNNNGLPVMLAMMIVGAVVYALSFVLIRVLSRYRELAADRAAAILTGQPSTLASALVKISGQMTQIPSQDLRKTASANHLALVPAINGRDVRQWFSTHPTLEKRLEQLNKISGQLSQPS